MFHRIKAPTHPLFPEPLYFMALTDLLIRLAEQEHLDVIHVHYAVPHAAGAGLARDLLRSGNPRANTPAVVTTLHGSDVTMLGSSPEITRVTGLSIRSSDAVTTVSRYLRDEAVRRLGIVNPIEIIPNFVTPKSFHPRRDRSLRRLFATDEEGLIVHVSNFRPVKRVMEVVRIFALIAPKVPTRLLLVGDGPELPGARQEAEALGLADRVHFLGHQTEVAPLLAVADLFLLPSLNESFGVAATEAMACGVPVIASDVGGLREVVVNGKTGFLFPPEDGEGMAVRAVELLRNHSLRRRIAEAATHHARGHYSPDIVVPMYENVYRGAVDRRAQYPGMTLCGDPR